MKTKPIELRHAEEPTGYGARQPRFEIYRQAHAGNHQSAFSTASAAAAVGTFLSLSPGFEGGELNLWNHQEQRTSASVNWVPEKVDFTSSVSPRLNVFHDPVLAALAWQAVEQRTLSETIEQQVRMSLRQP
jgi:hypothetical protein